MTTGLLRFKVNLFRQMYFSNLCKLCCNTSRAISGVFLIRQKSEQSTAYCKISVVLVIFSGISFTYSLKNNAPMTFPWGTPCLKDSKLHF